MSQIANIADKAQHLVKAKSPQILTALAVAGLVGTVVLAVKATPKATEDLYDAKHEKGEDLTVVETVQVAWKYYVPATATGLVAIACIVGANTVNTRRQAALMSLYGVTERAFNEYKEKVVQEIGDKKEQVVRDAIAQDHIDAAPPIEKKIAETGHGNTLCRDEYSGRYFRSSMERLRKAEVDLNFKILHDDSVSLNEFYSLLNLEPTKVGDELGWNTDRKLELDITSGISSDGEPVLVIDYRVNPTEGYYKFGR